MNPDLLAGTQEGNHEPQGDILTYILERTDLVIDATAKIGVHHLLTDYCLRMGLNLICSHSTLGAWGGMVVRFMPDQDKGCWVCLERHINDDPKFIDPPREQPEDSGFMQAVGCAEPTFLGASFDLAEVVLEIVRTAIGTLSDQKDDYPNSSWDIAVVNLRNKEGERIPPQWSTRDLPKHPDCECEKIRRKHGLLIPLWLLFVLRPIAYFRLKLAAF